MLKSVRSKSGSKSGSRNKQGETKNPQVVVTQGFKFNTVAEREESGHLYKIIKDLYQTISKLSENQEVTDII